ncbi:MAG: T9SS type A sorting domain-containing protein [Calditrichaeota bacterium]|nr:T9SS type A sorting domain-containing protein [Calditrichota bacterium]
MKDTFLIQVAICILILSVSVIACPGGKTDCDDTIEFVPTQKAIDDVDDEGWVKFEGNPVFTEGGRGEWDEDGITCFMVRHYPPAYYMWYLSRGKIGLAQSRDGVGWVRNRNNPVMVADSGRSYMGPEVLYDGETFRMWYIDRGAEYNGISYATSPNGWDWEPYENNPVTTHSGCIAVIYDGEQYRMFKQMGGFTLETSPDGINWTDHGEVFHQGAQHDFDEVIAGPSVAYYEGQLHLFYSAADTVGNRRGEIATGHVTSDDWGESWNYPDNREDMRTLRPTDPWEGYGIYSAGVDYDGEEVYIWYASAAGRGFGFASRPVNSVNPKSDVENPMNLWTVSPNPTSGPVKINYLGTLDGPSSVAMFDMTGRNLFNKDFAPNEPIRLDPLSIGLPVGQYMLRISSRGNEFHKQLVLVK